MSDSETESSTSDHFVDAEETVEGVTAPSRGAPVPTTITPVSVPTQPTLPTMTSPDIEDQIQILTDVQLAGRDQRWRRLEKLRRKGEEEEAGVETEEGETVEGRMSPNSTESSVEGIFVSGVRGLHPFKVVESDSRSIQSESRSAISASRSSCRVSVDEVPVVMKPPQPQISVERTEEEFKKIEEETVVRSPDPGNRSRSRSRGQEEEIQASSVPDIVSSALVHPVLILNSPTEDPPYHSTPTSLPMAPPPRPIAPPRKKRTAEGSRQQSEEEVVVEAGLVSPGDGVSRPVTLALTGGGQGSPAQSTYLSNRGEKKSLRSALPNLPDNHSVAGLNMSAAMRGEFVVRPQDDEGSRGSSVPVEDGSEACGGGGQTGLQGGGGGGGEEVEVVGGGRTDFSQDPSGSGRGSGSRAGHTHSHSEGDINLGQRGSSLKGRSSRPHDGYTSGGSGGNHSGGSGGNSGSSKGLGTGGVGQGGRGSGESRKSGYSVDSEGGIIKQMNMFIRTKSDSGKRLTDQEMLRQIKVKNLDTGAEMDLHTAEEQLPQSINPLSLHIMRLTNEYTGTRFSDTMSMDSDNDSLQSSLSDFEIGQGKKKPSFGRLLNNVTKSAKNAAKGITGLTMELSTRRQRNKEEKEEKLGRLATDIAATDGVQVSSDGSGAGYAGFKRIQAHKSGPTDFINIQFGQDLSGHHQGPIWCMKFSLNGWLLATAGQDCILRIWVLRDKHQHFNDMRRKYQLEHEGLTDEQIHHDERTKVYFDCLDSEGHIFMDRPFVTYTGHTSDLLDISWSKNYFILTSSMDKTVRLWHISRKECLCVFQHIDFVTALAFHPKNDEFFISGSLDGKIRLWNIPDKKVALWNEVPGTTKLITAANYCQNGKFAVVGTYDGRCIFFSTDQLKYHTTIHVRSARGKNSRGRKVTGIEPMPGEDKILITSNDSRIRLYDLRDLSLVCKYKGYTNLSSQIRAAFSPDGRYICAGSENQCVFLWSSLHTPQALTARKDRNNYYEAIRAHSAVVTCSLFAPDTRVVFEAVERGRQAAGKAVSSGNMEGYVVISGDFDGDIKIFINQTGV